MNLVQIMVSYLYTGVMEKPPDFQCKLFEQLLAWYGLMPEYTINPKDLERISKVQETIELQKVPCTPEQTTNWEVNNGIKQEWVTANAVKGNYMCDAKIKQEIEYTVEDHSMNDEDIVSDEISDNNDFGDDIQTRDHALDDNIPDHDNIEPDIMDLDIQDDNKVNDINKDRGKEHGKCKEMQNEKEDWSMNSMPRMGPVKGPILLFHGPKAINAEK